MNRNNTNGIDLKCKTCCKDFWICKSCYRGHRYCCDSCRHTGRKQNQKISKIKYEQSEEAKADHRDRQQAYRNRIKESNKSVTEQSSISSNYFVQATSQTNSFHESIDFCICCGSSRFKFVGGTS